MKFISTKNKNIRYSLSEAIYMGLANDGGLFIPEYFPIIDLSSFSEDLSYPDFAAKTLEIFFKNDNLAASLPDICATAFTFPIPIQQLDEKTFFLELFHGPTLSFKDVGARFLAGSLNKIANGKKITILVATSGDTGSAVASAFYKKTNINVCILYPKGQISVRQEQQITCWGKNILALAVQGSFDDCQQLVKSAFTDSLWQKQFRLSSANSINIGRLLPQTTYYAFISLQFYRQHGIKPGFIIPTGNLGNATAAYYAKALGFPINEIILATNTNKVLSDYLQTGNYIPRKSVSTLANAMDVGNPNNFARLKELYPHFTDFKKNVRSISVSDNDIKSTIINVYRRYKKMICPHTATAFYVKDKLADNPWIVVGTAHPCKFETIIEPLINASISIPEQLQTLLIKSNQIVEIDNNLQTLKNTLIRMMPS